MKHIDEILITSDPERWDLIKAGTKTIEIFKTKPPGIFYPFRCFVYLPGVGVVGCFDCDSICLTIYPEKFAGDAAMTEKEISEYSNGTPLCGWHIQENSVVEYETPFPLEMATGFKTAPETWQYIKRECEYE